MAPVKKKQKISNGGVGTATAAQATEQAHTPAAEAAAENEKAVQQRRSLFVRSLPATTTSDSLAELFSDSYPIKHAVAVTDPATKECRGYGFVTFADAEDAARAREQFNGHVLESKKLRVEIAEPRQRSGEGSVAESGAKKHQEEPQQPPKLIVRNLPWSIKGSEQLTKLFMSYGKVKQAYVPKRGPGLLAGFGFVIMRGKKNAEKAIEGVNGKEVDGRTLAVDWAVEKGVYQDLLNHQEEEQPGNTEQDDNSEAEDVDTNGKYEGEVYNDDSEMDEEDDMEDDVSSDDAGIDAESSRGYQADDRSSTLFVRNLPFTCSDEDLEDQFSHFGSTRYARVVIDHETERSKGTGFVCFYNKGDADACLRNAPSRSLATGNEKNSKAGKLTQQLPSILQNEFADPAGQYTMDGRVLQISRAVDKSEATRLTEEGVANRYQRDNDKRKLYLLSEGTISTKSKLWDQLPPSEKAMREASAKQRKSLIESNPSLHLSLTRLSIRNIPRSIGSKELKELARQGVVGFASDVKEGLRQKLSREEVARGGEEMLAAEKARKQAGKGIVKQAKVVFESGGGSKISEDAGAGRSRGYGFIEYHTHRNALMGLRWLNGHAVGYQVKDGQGKLSREEVQDRKKRLIVEFAIENAQVVMRRNETEQKAKARSHATKQGVSTSDDGPAAMESSRAKGKGDKPGSRKRKRNSDVAQSAKTVDDGSHEAQQQPGEGSNESLARRNRIIGKKRAMRKARKGVKT